MSANEVLTSYFEARRNQDDPESQAAPLTVYTMPAEIERLANLVDDLATRIDDGKARMEEIKSEATDRVAGDPQFSNDQRRKAEIARLLKDNAEFNQVKRACRENEISMGRFERRASRLRREFDVLVIDHAAKQQVTSIRSAVK